MRAICSGCHLYRYLKKGASTCKGCRSEIAPCADCRKTRRLYAIQLCGVCYEDHRVRIQLPKLEQRLQSPSEYNTSLFKLYLLYIRRYNLKYCHLRQTKKLIHVLEENPLSTITTWMDIYKLAERYPLFHQPSSKKGCAITKIGVMLQELGALPPRAEELGRQFENIHSGFSITSLPLIKKFEQTLHCAHRSAQTIQKYLRSLRLFEHHLNSRISVSSSLLDANSALLEDFLIQLTNSPDATKNSKYLYDITCSLDRFYRFCLAEKKILSNPCELISVSRAPFQIQICPPEQMKKLQAYVKNPNSNPEYALLISLVLFFGLTTEDLIFAQIQELKLEKPLTIVLRRKPRTHGRRYYHRPQTLTLPREPFWLARLQKKFLTEWQTHYSQVKSTYPRFSLLLPRTKKFNRPLSTDSVLDRLYQATRAATGVAIPIRVLRQTCGHLHTHGQDSSSLTRLGWSPQFAFHYSWKPKTFFTPKPPKSSTT